MTATLTRGLPVADRLKLLRLDAEAGRLTAAEVAEAAAEMLTDLEQEANTHRTECEAAWKDLEEAQATLRIQEQALLLIDSRLTSAQVNCCEAAEEDFARLSDLLQPLFSASDSEELADAIQTLEPKPAPKRRQTRKRKPQPTN